MPYLRPRAMLIAAAVLAAVTLSLAALRPSAFVAPAPDSDPARQRRPRPMADGSVPWAATATRPTLPRGSDRRDPLEGLSPAQRRLLAHDFEDLALPADSGDRHAACYLGFKLLRCVQADRLRYDRLMMSDEIPSDLDATNIAALLRARPIARAFVSTCDDAPEPLFALGVSYVRQAALAGEPEALFRYVIGDGTFDDHEHTDSPEFETWAEEAPEMLWRAFEAGYPPAIVELWEAYLSDGAHSSTSPVRMIPKDPLKGEAMQFLLHRLSGGGPKSYSPRFPDLLPQAMLLADEWRDQYFRNADFPSGEWPVHLDRVSVSNIFYDEREYQETEGTRRLLTCSR